MKKKILLKEAELNKLIPKLLEDVIKEGQLELDFGVDPKDEAVASLLEEKYEEISNEIKNELNYVKTSGRNETVYNTLESIHSDKIFPLWKELDRVGDSYGRIDEITDKFNTLEDVLVNCLEIYKEWKTLNDEFNNSVEELNSLIIFSISRL